MRHWRIEHLGIEVVRRRLTCTGCTRRSVGGTISRLRRPHLHLRPPQLLPLPVVPGYAPEADVGAVVVWAVEEGVPAVVEPPAGLPLGGAAGVPSAVVVAVRGGELHAVVLVQRVLRTTRVTVDRQPVLVPLARHLERCVHGVHAIAREIP